MDTNNPDNNLMFKVWKCKNMMGHDDKSILEGYYIQIPSDVQWILDDQETEFYKAWLFSENQILVQAPAQDYDDVHSRDSILYHYDWFGNQGIQQIDDYVIGAMDAVNNRHTEEPLLKENQM